MLVETPATFVREAFVQLDPDAPDQIAGWIQLDGPGAAGAATTLEIPAARIKLAASTGALTGHSPAPVRSGASNYSSTVRASQDRAVSSVFCLIRTDSWRTGRDQPP